MIWLIATVCYPLFILFGWPNLLLVNSALSTGETQIIEGEVIRKTIGGKGGTYVLHVLDNKTAKAFKVEVKFSTYDSAHYGTPYKTCFQVGVLGIPYYWRFASAPDDCLQTG